MKPKLKLKAGFWQCTTPEAQGLGVTPAMAWKEWLALWIECQQIEQRRREAEHQASMMEFYKVESLNQVQMACLAHGMVMDNSGKIVRDFYLETLALGSHGPRKKT